MAGDCIRAGCLAVQARALRGAVRAGGSSEIIARATAGELSRTLGQSVFVDNKPGASGNIAMAEVARADDQHTLILGHIGTLAVNLYMYDKLPYDANKDFADRLLAKVPSLYVVHPNLPAKDLREFVALVRSKPGQMNYGSAGNGSAGHLAMEYLKMTAGIFITHIWYKGTGPQLTDLLADGWTQPPSAPRRSCSTSRRASCAASPPARPSAWRSCPMCPRWRSRASRLRDDAVVRHARTRHHGPGQRRQAAAETQKAMNAQAALERLNQDAAQAIGGTPAQFAQFIAQEQKRWKQVVERAWIKPE